MLRAVIIDDEQNNIDNLVLLLQKHCSEVQIAGTARQAGSGKELIEKEQPDLLFLDIQMPGKSGFELLRDLPEHNFQVIFVTAYDQYGIQAIKFSALDYLLKPVKSEELKEAVRKAGALLSKKQYNLQLDNLIHLLQQKQGPAGHRIALTTLKETRFVETGTICRCESLNNYTRFFLENGEELLVSRSIYEYEELLKDYGFIRCHQSHLVNTRFVKSWLRKEGDQLVLQNGNSIPVSRNKKETVKEFLFRRSS